jgi:hypothetical protein
LLLLAPPVTTSLHIRLRMLVRKSFSDWLNVAKVMISKGRAIAQAVSRRLPTAAARVLVMWDFMMDKSGAGTGFLGELRFPLPIYIPSASPQSSSPSPEAGTIDQEWPQCQ